jgi:hypothetical protein
MERNTAMKKNELLLLAENKMMKSKKTRHRVQTTGVQPKGKDW